MTAPGKHPFLLAMAGLFLFAAAPSLSAQSAPLINGSIDDSTRINLAGGVHPLLVAAHRFVASSTISVDEGEAEEELAIGRQLLLLARPDEQESALEERIAAMHSPGNALYHQWLKPGELGATYGLAESDVAAVVSWLEGHGLTVSRITAGRTALEFTGTAGQMREAFGTSLHRYQIAGAEHLGLSGTPSVPAALAPAIRALAPVTTLQP